MLRLVQKNETGDLNTILADIAAVMAMPRPSEAMDDWHDPRRWWWSQAEQHRQAVERRERQLKRRAAAEFTERNNWRPYVGRFPPEQIGRGIGKWRGLWDTQVFDHCWYFRQKSRNAAIVAQPYGREGVQEKAEQLAQRLGLKLSVPPAGAYASVYYPAKTLFLVFTLPDVAVAWLPEQECAEDDRWRERRQVEPKEVSAS